MAASGAICAIDWSGRFLQGEEAAATAFSWPQMPMRDPRWRQFRRNHKITNKKSKDNLLLMMRDRSTQYGKSKWCIQLMHKFKFFTTAWEYTQAMKKMNREGAWDEALKLWGEMRARNLEATENSYSQAIVACTKGKKFNKALTLFDDMEKENLFPNRYACEHALASCEQGKKWEKALHILDQMWEYGRAPNEESFMPAIRTLENAQLFERADKMFALMRQTTKLTKVQDELGTPAFQREPPKAEPTPWRIPGAVALDAFDPPKRPSLIEENGGGRSAP